jgi:hypothetical protein
LRNALRIILQPKKTLFKIFSIMKTFFAMVNSNIFSILENIFQQGKIFFYDKK